jgi:hypothetical protein
MIKLYEQHKIRFRAGTDGMKAGFGTTNWISCILFCRFRKAGGHERDFMQLISRKRPIWAGFQKMNGMKSSSSYPKP